jgi:glycosyltransferase involved in cell wall biosynthesis
MPAHNCEKYIKVAIESILNQTYKDFELIIINDCSTDNTLKIIQRYKKTDKRIQIINNKSNLGSATSRNKGIAKAKGKYIAIQDSDDVSLFERLELEYSFLEKNKDIFLIGGDALKIDETGQILDRLRTIKTQKSVLRKMTSENPLIHSTIMFRNNKKYKYRAKMKFCQDYDFYLNCLTHNEKMCNINAILVKYRIHSTSISFSKRALQDLFAEKAKLFYRQRKDSGRDEYYAFNPDSILNLDIEHSTLRHILESEIRARIQLEDLKGARPVIKKYFKYHGTFSKPKIIIYFLLTYLNKPSLRFIKKIRSLIRGI